MSYIIDALNRAFDVDGFELIYKVLPASQDDIIDGFKFVHHAFVQYDGVPFLRVKRYSKSDGMLVGSQEFLKDVDDLIMRSILFSTPASEKYKYLIRTFADVKNDIIKNRDNG